MKHPAFDDDIQVFDPDSVDTFEDHDIEALQIKPQVPRVGAPKKKSWRGILKTSFQMLGSLQLAATIILDGYPDVGDTNQFLESLKNHSVIVTIEEARP